jgi:cupin 2 domain-containing protein
MFDNLLDDLPNAADQEQLVDLLKHPGVRIERIVSTGQSSPPGKAGPRDDRIA